MLKSTFDERPSSQVREPDCTINRERRRIHACNEGLGMERFCAARQARVHTCTHLRAYTYTCLRMRGNQRPHTYWVANSHADARMHAHTHTHMHVCCTQPFRDSQGLSCLDSAALLAAGPADKPRPSSLHRYFSCCQARNLIPAPLCVLHLVPETHCVHSGHLMNCMNNHVEEAVAKGWYSLFILIEGTL